MEEIQLESPCCDLRLKVSSDGYVVWNKCGSGFNPLACLCLFENEECSHTVLPDLVATTHQILSTYNTTVSSHECVFLKKNISQWIYLVVIKGNGLSSILHFLQNPSHSFSSTMT